MKLKRDEDDASRHPMVSVFLLAKVDHVKDFEVLIPESIFITRALRNFEIKVDIDQSAADVYEHSLNYFKYEGKLYGPQVCNIYYNC